MSMTHHFVETVQVGADVERKACAIICTTRSGEQLLLDVSGESLLAIAQQIEKLRTKVPQLDQWKTVSKQ